MMISICMPYYMRQDLLDMSLGSLHQHYAGMNLEVVICDDGSPVPVVAPGCRVVYLPVKHHALNPCVPINQAVAMALGEITVLTNPEIEHRAPVLQEMARDLGPDDYMIAACRDVASGFWLCGSHVRGGENGRGPIPLGAGFHFCTMLHRDLFYLAGGFDEAYRDGHCFDDNDWLYRLQRAGARFRMRDDLVVWHHQGTRCAWPEGGHERNRRRFEAVWGMAP